MNQATLIRSIRSRSADKGIITADRFLSDLTQCVGGRCPSEILEGVTKHQWNAWLKAASQKLTYQAGSIGDFARKAADGNTLPPHTIATFPCVITTTTQDRDGDVLESKGAQPDPLMPLLWQHIPDMPIGRAIGKQKVQSNKVTGRFTVANTALGQDAALLAEHGALRISHGFLPLKWEPLESGEGFHILEFKILETSLVSIPSNPDAVIEAFSREKLAHPLVKAWAGAKFGARPAVVPVGIELGKPEEKHACTCSTKTAEVTETKSVIPFSDAPVSDKAWDADAAVKRGREWAGVNEDDPPASAWKKYRKLFAIQDGDADNFGSYKFPYHDIDDGKLVLVPKGVAAAIGALNGARGGTKISDEDRKGAYAVLVKAYKKCYPDQDPPELKAIDALETKGVYVEFENSWDDIRCDLSDSLLSFLMATDVAGPADLAYIVDMFPDHAIVCVVAGANAFYGPFACDTLPLNDERISYYSVTWSMGGDEEPAWTGTPQKIEITPQIQPAAERALRAMSEKGFLKPKHVEKLAKAMDHLQDASDHEEATGATKKLSKGAHAAIKSVHEAHDKGILTSAHRKKLEKAMGYCSEGAEHEEATAPVAKSFKAAHKLVKDVMDDAGDEASATPTDKGADDLETKGLTLGPEHQRKVKSAIHHFKAIEHHDDAGNEHQELARKAYQPLQDMPNQPDSDPDDEDYETGRGEPSDAAGKAAKIGKANIDKINKSIEHGEALAKHKSATQHIKSLAKHAVAHLKAIVKPDDPAGEAGENGAEGTEGTNGNPPKSAEPPVAKTFFDRCNELLDIAIDSAALDEGDDLLTLASAGSKAGKLLRRRQAGAPQQ